MIDEEAPTKAVQIATEILDVTGSAMADGDFQAFKTCFQLPLDVDTFDGQRCVTTEDEMMEIFEASRTYLCHRGVTDMVRRIVSAQFEKDGSLHAIHESRLLAGTIQIQDSYLCYSLIKQFGDDWKVVFSQYAIADSPAHNHALTGKKTDPPS